MKTPKVGDLLIAEPFLQDPTFKRSVILLCDYNADGSFGLLLNKQMQLLLSDIFEELTDCEIPIFFGGPVQMDTLHILHQVPELISHSQQIGKDIYWGGNITQIIDLIKEKKIDNNKIKFYLGYSGWDNGQLIEEFEEHKTWVAVEAKASLVFKNNVKQLWSEALTYIGGEYAQWKIYPTHPQLN